MRLTDERKEIRLPGRRITLRMGGAPWGHMEPKEKEEEARRSEVPDKEMPVSGGEAGLSLGNGIRTNTYQEKFVQKPREI